MVAVPSVVTTPVYAPLDASGLADQAHHALRAMILRRVHPPGSRLDIQALAREMGISTAPLRDAVRRLEVEGLVEIHSRRGTFVTQITSADVRELFEVRRALELAAARVAVRRFEAASLAALGSLLEQLEQWLRGPSPLDYDDYLGIDAEFHRRIVAAAENQFLSRLYDSLQAHTHVARAKYVGGTHRRWQSLDEHQAILAALRARDVSRLEQAVQAHLAAAEADLLAHLARSAGAAAEPGQEPAEPLRRDSARAGSSNGVERQGVEGQLVRAGEVVQ